MVYYTKVLERILGNHIKYAPRRGSKLSYLMSILRYRLWPSMLVPKILAKETCSGIPDERIVLVNSATYSEPPVMN